MEDQWELWDVLNLLYAGGYDVTRLWKADPRDARRVLRGDPARAVPAVLDRLGAAARRSPPPRCSWSSPASSTPPPRRRGRTRGSGRERRRTSCAGPASRAGDRLSLQIVSAPRFRLPADPARPVVMFAAGSGIAPFLGFVAARTGPGENRLYLGIRTPEEFVERADLDAAAAAGRLRALGRVLPRRRRGRLRRQPPCRRRAGQRRRVDDADPAPRRTRSGSWCGPAEDGGRGRLRLRLRQRARSPPPFVRR